jgi:hypothetical protein
VKDGVCSGKPKHEVEDDKQRMWEAQQEVLRARRSGKSLEGVSERRAKAKQAVWPILTLTMRSDCRVLIAQSRTREIGSHKVVKAF